MAECILCGKEFNPYNSRHIYCSKECCYSETLRKKSEEYYECEDVRRKKKIYERKRSTCYCKICNKPIKRVFIHDHEKTQMHDECIIKDCVETLKAGKKLSTCQRQRLYSRSYTIRELIRND